MSMRINRNEHRSGGAVLILLLFGFALRPF